ncbi:MAG: polyamine aminopropyltransferase [Gammaproteobacteria bacterium]|nr:polyamine aminopropyltransferase [Gammaproteobacteria bacterium]
MALDEHWFTEVFEPSGSAFSLRITAKLHQEQTPYQRIEIYQTTEFGYLMVIDGCTMVSSRDNFLYHEMMSHPVLFTHAKPQQVLIIGGGDCGTLLEVLRHPQVQHCTQVDIDERVTRLSEKYFPELCASNSDPRAELRFDDGVKWLQDANPGSYDIIIVDSTDPVGPAEGLFNEVFFRTCHRALRDGGILVQQSESPLIHVELIKSMHHAMRNAGFSNTHSYDFPQPIYPSGWWSATLAGKGRDLKRFRESESRHKSFTTKYYSYAKHLALIDGVPLLNTALK